MFLKMKSLKHLAAILIAGCCFTNCTNDDTEPSRPGEYFIATYLPTDAPLTGSSFLHTGAIENGSTLSSADALEATPFAYTFVNGNEVIVTSYYLGDQVIRYTRTADGRLQEAGRFTAPASSGPMNVLYANSSKAYLSLSSVGKILIFNPQTMTISGEIDLNQLDIARNPVNPEDTNPDPAVMAIRDGKLYVSLWQVTNSFFSADGTDIAVFDSSTDTFEGVISDPRMATPGRAGYNESMFVDEAGDLYIHGIASFGFVPGQKTGFLRIRKGESRFDPDYFFDLTSLSTSLPGSRVTYFAGLQYAGEGEVFGQIEVPGLFSSPPDYVNDRNYQPVKVNLLDKTLEVLPLPAGNGYSAAVSVEEDRVLFGLSAQSGSGIFSYDRKSGEGTATPVVKTNGSPSNIKRLN